MTEGESAAPCAAPRRVEGGGDAGRGVRPDWQWPLWPTFRAFCPCVSVLEAYIPLQVMRLPEPGIVAGTVRPLSPARERRLLVGQKSCHFPLNERLIIEVCMSTMYIPVLVWIPQCICTSIQK